MLVNEDRSQESRIEVGDCGDLLFWLLSVSFWIEVARSRV